MDPAIIEETPFELIEDQPEWRQQYLRNVATFNRYYDAPTCIRILPEFDPRPERRDEWAPYHTDLLQKYINWPIISPEHLHFKNTSTTRIVINNFINKYATSPDPSIRKTVLNLWLLDILLVDNLITVDAHMEPLNVNPNAPLPPYTDSRLYHKGSYLWIRSYKPLRILGYREIPDRHEGSLQTSLHHLEIAARIPQSIRANVSPAKEVQVPTYQEDSSAMRLAKP